MPNAEDHHDEMAKLEADYEAETAAQQAAAPASKEWIEIEGLSQEEAPIPISEQGIIIDAPKPADEPAKPKAEMVQQPKATPIPFDERGIMVSTNAAEEMRVARWFLATGACPDTYRTAEQVVLGIQLLKSFDLNVLASIRFTGYINGVLYVWGDLPKAIVINSGKMEWMREHAYVIDENNKMVQRCLANGNLHLPAAVSVCLIKAKGDDEVYEFSYSTAEAQVAGLLPGKDSSAWKKYTRRMLQLRARAQGLKDTFPDVLTAVRIKEYDLEGQDDGKALPGQSGLASEINQLYGEVVDK